MRGKYPLDLVVLVADLDQQEALRSLLDRRHQSLGIRKISHEILKHPRRDPGSFNESPAVLQPYQERAAHALVLLDRDGSGQEVLSVGEIEANLNARLAASGWEDRACAVVIDPELEAWAWSDSPRVDEGLGWAGRAPPLREWLHLQGLWPADAQKPPRPKEALRAALKEVRQRPVAPIFGNLAATVGLDRCQDPSFTRLRAVLKTWFHT